MAEKEELKSLLMKAREENEKAGLKLNIQKTKIIASGPLTSWQIEREKVESCDRFSSLGLWSHHFMAYRWETMTDFIFLGSKITADGDCSHEIERCLLRGRKAVTNLESRDITLPTKVCLVKAVVFPVVVYECECWTIRKAEC